MAYDIDSEKEHNESKEEYLVVCPFPIAILLATFNGEEYILQQLESILNQTNSEYVCYIHDDGSSDHTIEIVNDFCNMHLDHFVFLGSSKTGGAKNNFVYMLNVVKADYIMFCDQDDVWLPEKVEISFKEIQDLEKSCSQPMCCCIYTDVKVVDENLKEIRPSFYEIKNEPIRNSIRDELVTNVCIGHTMMINNETYKLLRKTDNWNRIYMHDWWIGILCSIFGKMSYVNMPLALYRQHSENAAGIKIHNSLIKKMKNLSSCESYLWWRKKRIDHLKIRRDFAKELVKIIPQNHNEYKFIYDYSMIEYKCKFKRLVFYYRNKLFDIRCPLWEELLFL